MTLPVSATQGAGPAAWHDVECASYVADLPVWRDLAQQAQGPVLDLGCGTGRVALDLARAGASVTGVDADAPLVEALSRRAKAAELDVRAETADARSLDLGRARFALAIAPMQMVQLLGGPEGRASMLAAVRDHLETGALLAIALADPFEAVPAGEALPPLPDVLEIDGWVLSSAPVEVRDEADAVAIVRHRQAVSPSGDLFEEMATVRLDSVTPAGLQEEAEAHGYQAESALGVPATPDYVGSTVVCLRAT